MLIKENIFFFFQLNGFFRGMAFPLLTSGMLNSILFGIYGNELRRLQSLCATKVERNAQWRQNVFLAGSEAGFIYSFIACPFELVKIRLQTQNRKSSKQCFEFFFFVLSIFGRCKSAVVLYI